MAKAPSNKAELSRKKRQLATYQRFLPSLDMKRKQLMAERQRERGQLAEIRAEQEAARRRVGDDLPMLADAQIPVDELVRIAAVQLGEQNVVGVRLPTLADVDFEVASYGYLALPHWVDQLVAHLQAHLTLSARHAVAEERLKRLEEGLRTVTKRVNLFDKVLIPNTEAEIQRIEIALGDAERAGVVRAKIAKRKRAEARS